MEKKPRMGEDPLSRFKNTTTPTDQPEAPGNPPPSQKVRKPSPKSPQKPKKPSAGGRNKKEIALSLKKLESLKAELEDLKQQNLSLRETVTRMQVAEGQEEKEAEPINLTQKFAYFEEKIQSMEAQLARWRPAWWEWWRWWPA
jgi:hypothetical protein